MEGASTGSAVNWYGGPLFKALLPIFLVVVVDVLAMTIILPLLPFYAEHLGASPTVVGLLVSAFAICQLVGGPLLGRLSDRTGRKPLLLVSQVGTLTGFIILAYANSLALIFLSRIIDGLTAGNISLAQAYIVDVTKPEERTKSFAVIGIAFGIGFLLGPALSGFLSQFGYRYPIFAAMALSLASILTTWFLLPSTKTHMEDDSSRRLGILDWSAYAEYFRRPDLAPLLWQFFAFIMAFSTFMSGFALFAERRFTWNGHAFGPKEVGYVYAYVGLIGIFLQGGLIPRLVRWLGDEKLVRVGFLISGLGSVALAFTYNIPALLAASVLISFSGVIRPALTTLITVKAGRSEQGSVLGLNQSLQSVASIIAPLISGALIEHRLLATWALMAAAFSAIGLFLPMPSVPLRETVTVHQTGTSTE